MEDIFEILSLSWFLGIKKLQKFLNEGRSDVHLQSFDVGAIVDDELQEELVDGLEVRPCGVREGFFLHDNKFTYSMPMPSPGRPCFLRTGRGRKMFFSIMLMTRSRWGMMTVDMQF